MSSSSIRRAVRHAVGDLPAARRPRPGHRPAGSERLEPRQLLSGETVTAGLGATPLPAGASVQVVYRATVDSPLAKGVGTVYGQGSVSGTNFATVRTDDPDAAGTADPTATAVDRAPRVTKVFVRNSGWSGTFLTAMAAANAGEAAFGSAVPAGAGQLAALPWAGIDRVSVRFSEPVTVAADDLTVFGGAGGGPLALSAAGFAYDATSRTATWALAAPVAAANDALRLIVDASAAGVVQSAGGAGGRLDGEWLDGSAAFDSGDGVAGGDFSFRLNVLGNDANGDGAVNTTDPVVVRRGLSPAAYDPRLDVNADGAVNTTDFVQARGGIGATLTANAPGGTPGAGWVAATTATPPNPAGVAGTTVTATTVDALAVDVDADGQADPGDTVQYTVTITNTGASDATGVSLSTVLDPRMTLVAGSVRSSPVIAGADAGSLAYTENGPAAAIVPNLSVADPDGTLSGATAQISSGYQFGQDTLGFTLQNGIGFAYDGALGKVTFSGSATVAAYQAVLRSVTYTNTSDNPSTAPRTVSFQVTDGTTPSNVVTRGITVAAVNDAPTVTASANAAATFTEGGAAAVVDAGLLVADAESDSLNQATVSITAGLTAGDVLTVTNAGGLTVGYSPGTGVLTLTGTATVAAYQAALRSVTFSSTSDNPTALGTATARTIAFAARDANNATSSPAAVRTVNVVNVNDAPTATNDAAGIGEDVLALTTVANVLTGAGGGTADSDPDGPSALAVTAVQGGTVGTTFTRTSAGGRGLLVNLAADGTLRVNPNGAFEALDDVNAPLTDTVTFTYTVGDGATTSTATVTVTVNGANDPIVAGDDLITTITEDSAATDITAAVKANDADPDAGDPKTITGNTAPAKGTVTLAGGVLGFNPGAAFNTLAQGTTEDVTFDYTVSDGTVSDAATVTVRVQGVNDAPVDPDESFTAQANVGVSGTGASGLLAGATDVDAGDAVSMAAASVGTFPTAQGGSITVAANGTFTYTPQAGDRGIADTFTYAVKDNFGGTNTSTVTFNVDSNVIWFVDLAVPSNGTGTLASPFNSLAPLDNGGPDATGDTIFLYRNDAATGTVTLADDFDLQANQLLIGEGVAGTNINTVRGFTTYANSLPIPAVGAASNPVVTATNVDALTLATGNTVRGVDVGNTGTGTKIKGTGFGTLTLDDVALSGTGGALGLTTGTIQGLTAGSTAAFNALSSSSSVNAVSLTTVAGGLSGPAGSGISGATGDDFLVNGGTVTVAYAGTITNTAGRSVNVSNKTAGGDVTFGGAISDTGTGILLDNNDGATVTFSGGLSLSTGANTAFSAVNGGTVAATQNNTTVVNTIATTSGTGLNVSGTTIGASGLTFRSISSGAGGGNGITLSGTGSGPFTVTGTGAANSGGVISGRTGADGTNGTTGTGIYLNNVGGAVSLTRMDIEGNQNYGIRGISVTGGLAIDNTTVGMTATNGTNNFTSPGNQTDAEAVTLLGGEASVRFTNLTGAVNFTNDSFDRGFGRTVLIHNSTVGSTLNLNITNSTLRQSLNNTNGGDTTGNTTDAITLQGINNTVMNVTISGSHFTAYRQFGLLSDARDTASMNFEVANCDFSNENTGNVGASTAMNFGGGGGTATDVHVKYYVHNSTFRHGSGATVPTNGGAQIVSGGVSGGSAFDGKIINNTFGVDGLARSGAGNGADVLRLFASGNQAATNGSTGSTHTRYLVQGNTIQNYGEVGIQINARQGNSIIDATIIGNVIRQPGTAAQGAFAAIWVNSGALAADTNTVNIAIGGANAAHKNTLTGSDPSNATAVFLDSNTNGGAASFVNVYRNGSVAAAGATTEDTIRNILVSNNTVLATELDAGFTNANAARPMGIQAGLPSQPALLAAPGGVAALSTTPVKALTQSQLNALKAAAIQRWQKAGGLTAKQVQALRATSFVVADLGGATLGLASGRNRVVIDDDAAGYGWYVDTTPADDKEFAVRTSATRLYANPTAAPAGRMDLLTAVMHELGHVLGLDHVALDRDSLMFDALTTGERRLPAKVTPAK